MATHKRTMRGGADAVMAHLHSRIVGGSITAQAEGRSDQSVGGARMLVRTYERYSFLGGNRVSLTVAILAVGPNLAVSLMTAGGSQAVFWKVNTFGEEAFLSRAVEALDAFKGPVAGVYRQRPVGAPEAGPDPDDDPRDLSALH